LSSYSLVAMKVVQTPLTLCTVILCMIIGAGCSQPDPEQESSTVALVGDQVYIPQDSPLRDAIEVEVVQEAEIAFSVEAPATVEADPSRRAQILPPAPGRIVRLFVRLGERVTEGQPLFELYSPEIAEVQTAYLTSVSQRAQAERTLNRAEVLLARGILPEREVEELRTELEIARSEVEGTRLRLRILGLKEEEFGRPLVVRAPLTGNVLELSGSAGAFITEPDEPLMVIADLRNVWITARVQEKDIRFIQLGMQGEATLSAWPGERFVATVAHVDDVLDEESRSIRVRLSIPNTDRRLKPGMFARVTFQGGSQVRPLVPVHALRQAREGSFVYVETGPHTYVRRNVETGHAEGTFVSVLSGLSAGERIVSRNALLLP